MGFLDFVLKCIQLLAWPSFTLGYPLCASIRAIETNSDFHMRKLVAYWILFSLISLFEYTFSTLQWVPEWPYVKIVAICWLVIPGFNGASIAYNNILRPCLSMLLPQIIVDMLNKKQDVSLTRESFLEEEERYVKENGTGALEKLFANKPIVKEPPVAQKDIKAVEFLDKRVTAAENKTTTVDTDIKVNNTILPEKLTENEFLAPPAFKNVQKEWTCAVCQVTTQSERTLNSHLQGMKHKTKCEELKAGKQTEIKKGVSTKIKHKNLSAIPEVKIKANVSNGSHLCSICNVTCTSESDMASHLLGKRHLSTIEDSGLTRGVHYWCNICDVKCLSEIDIASHLKGKTHDFNLYDSD